MLLCVYCILFFFKQKTAYEMRISDWSSDVCSSDLHARLLSFCASSVAVGRFHRLSIWNLLRGFYLFVLRGKPVVTKTERRSEERRVGKKRVSTCRSRWSQYH